jgi:hypothetical protein
MSYHSGEEDDDNIEMNRVDHNDNDTDDNNDDDSEIISAGSESDSHIELENDKESFLGTFFNYMKNSLMSIRETTNIFLNNSMNENDDIDINIPQVSQGSPRSYKFTPSPGSPESTELTIKSTKYEKITDSMKTSGHTPVKWNIVDNELKKLNDNIKEYKERQLSRRDSKSIQKIVESESGVSFDDTKLISDIIDQFETVYDENQNLLNNVNLIMENDLELNKTVSLLYNKQQRIKNKMQQQKSKKNSTKNSKKSVVKSSKKTTVSKRVYKTTSENKNMNMTKEQIKQLLIGVINGNVKSKKLKDYIIYLTKNLNDTNNTKMKKSEKDISTIVTMVDKSGMRNFMTENKNNAKILTNIFGNNILSDLDKNRTNYCYLCRKKINAGGAEVEHKCPAVVLLLLVDKLENNSHYKKYESDLEKDTNIKNLLYNIYTNLNGDQPDYKKLKQEKEDLKNRLKVKKYNNDFIDLLFQNINMYALSHKYCNQVKSDLRFMKWKFEDKSTKCSGFGCFNVEKKNINKFNESSYEFSNYVNEHPGVFKESTDRNSYVSTNNTVSQKATKIFELFNHPLFDPSRDGTNILISKTSMNNIKEMKQVDIEENDKKLTGHFNYVARDYNTTFIGKNNYSFSEIIKIIDPNLKNLIINKLKKKKRYGKKRKIQKNNEGSNKKDTKRRRGGKKFSIKTRKNKKI